MHKYLLSQKTAGVNAYAEATKTSCNTFLYQDIGWPLSAYPQTSGILDIYHCGGFRIPDANISTPVSMNLLQPI